MKWISGSRLVIIIASLLMIATLNACSKKGVLIPALAQPIITSFTPTSGFAGDTILIAGSSFGGVTSVTFGTITASNLTVLSNTSIKAVVGIGATGFVRILAAGGKDSITGFTYKGIKPIDGYIYSNDVEMPSLIAHWTFDGNDSEMIHHALPKLTDGGTLSYVPGKLGQAIHLNNSWLTYGSEATDASQPNNGSAANDVLQNGFTLSLWAQVPDTSLLTNLFQLSAPSIVNNPIVGLAYRKYIDGSFDMNGAIINVDAASNYNTSTAAFKAYAFRDTLTWAYLAMTYNSTNKSLNYYANGVLSATINLTSLGSNNPFQNSATLLLIAPNYATIGTFQSTATTPGAPAGIVIPASSSSSITGNLDDIRVFKKTLTSQQISDLYLLGNLGR